jgi:hypothetical protein
MVRLIRSAKVKNGGTLMDALKWAKQTAEYLNSKFSLPKVAVYSGLFGDLYTIFWQADHESLASIEDAFAKFSADPGYLALLSKATSLFIEGSARDAVMRLV